MCGIANPFASQEIEEMDFDEIAKSIGVETLNASATIDAVDEACFGIPPYKGRLKRGIT